MPPVFAKAFAARKVFLTGHTGFKGSWLAIWLHHLGARVTGYSLAPPTEPSNFAPRPCAIYLAGHYEADVRDQAALNEAVARTRPEVVFHLAAQALVRESYQSPRETFDVNVLGTVGVLEAVRAMGRPCAVVVVTSDKCYENREQVWGYREIDPLGGHDPYSASKGAAEIVVAAYRRSFFPPAALDRHGVKLATARAGNVIGGGDWAKDRIIPDMVRHLVAGQPVPVRNPRGGAALAARLGAARRLFDAGRPDATIRRFPLVRSLELRPPAGRGNPGWPVGRVVPAGLGRGHMAGRQSTQSAARSRRVAVERRQGAAPTRLAAAVATGRSRAADRSLVSAVLSRRAIRRPRSVPCRHRRLRVRRSPGSFRQIGADRRRASNAARHAILRRQAARPRAHSGLVGTAARPAHLRHRRDGVLRRLALAEFRLGQRGIRASAPGRRLVA